MVLIIEQRRYNQNYIIQKKPSVKEYNLYDSTYIQNKNKENKHVTMRLEVGGDTYLWDMRGFCLLIDMFCILVGAVATCLLSCSLVSNSL